jgi:hypothetical protein
MNNGLKYLYSSGDSFSTPGTKKVYETDEILHGENFKSYADVISEKNNLILFDDSFGGGSNDMIMRKFMRFISHHNDKINETLFIINWSYSSRLEYVNSKTKGWTRFDKGVANVKSKSFNQEFLVNYFSDDYSDETKFRIPIFYLYHFLHGKGAKFLFSSTPGWKWKKFKSPAISTDKHKVRAYNVLSSINKKFFIKGIQQYLKKEHHQSYVDHHPNELGHKRISELIISKLNDIYNLNLI